jgi:hypothetical protein
LLDIQALYLGLKFTSQFGFNCYLDNFEIRELRCNPPDNIEVFNIASNTAEISWNEAIPDAGLGYHYEIRSSGHPLSGNSGLIDTDTITDGSDTAYISDLTANTVYYAYVRSVCGTDNNSVWAGPVEFRTCSPAMLPLAQDFSVAGDLFLPECWTQQYAVGNSNLSFVELGSNPTVDQDYDATGRMVFWNSAQIANGNKTRIISTPLSVTDFPAGDIEVNFQWFHSSLGGSQDYQFEGVQIQYSFNLIDWQNVGDFVKRYDINSGWDKKTIYLPISIRDEDVVYIAFEFSSNQGYNCYLDNVEIKAVTCYVPEGLVVSETTSNAATISWNEPPITPSAAYLYEVRTSGFPESGQEGFVLSNVATDTFAVVQPLETNTIYQIFLRSDCSADSSDWSDGLAFELGCSPVTGIVYERFNEIDFSYEFPDCWYQEYESGTADISFEDSGDNPSLLHDWGGLGRMVFWNSHDYPNGAQTRLVSKAMNTVGNPEMELNFNWYHWSAGGELFYTTEGVELQYSTDGSTWTSFDTIRNYNSVDGWDFKQIDLPPDFGEQPSVQLGFLFTSNNGFNCYMDDVVIKPKSTCTVPYDIEIQYLDTSRVDLSWLSSLTGANYEYELRTEGLPGSALVGLIATDTAGIDQMAVSIENLPADQDMTFYLRSVCSPADFSVWSDGYSFKTMCSIEDLPFLERFNLSIDCSNPPYCPLVLPDCWTAEGEFSNFYYISGYGYESGVMIFQAKANQGNSGYLTTPAINTTGVTDLELNFDWTFNSIFTEPVAQDSVKVQYSINGIDWRDAGLALPRMAALQSNRTFVQSLLLPADAGDQPALMLRFYFTSQNIPDNRELRIDDVELKEPVCLPPSNLAVEVLSDTSAVLSWEASPFNPNSEYTWYVEDYDDYDVSGTVGAGELTDTIYTLTPDEFYYFTVRSECGDGDRSITQGVVPFSTACEVQDLPVSQNFTKRGLPSCWFSSDDNGSVFANKSFGSQPFSGVGDEYFAIGDPDAGSPGVSLIAPQFNTIGLQNVECSFYSYHISTAPFNANKGVIPQYSLNGTDWISIGTIINKHSNKEGYRRYFFNLPNNAMGQEEVSLRFNFTSPDTDNLYLDNISIKEVSCELPRNLVVTNISFDSATLTWEAPLNSVPAGYEYELRTSGEAGSGATGLVDFGNTVGSTSTQLDLTDLPENEQYQIFVRSVCDDATYSGWTRNEFSLIYSTPLEEDFSTINELTFPGAWTQQFIDGDKYIYFSTDRAYGDEGRAATFDGDDYSDVNRLVSPLINTTNNSEISLNFYLYHTTEEPENQDKIIIQYSLDKENWISLSNEIYRYNETEGWKDYSIAMPTAFAGQAEVYLGLYFSSVRRMDIDNLSLVEIDNCLPPDEVSATFIGDTLASFNYLNAELSQATEYEYEVRTEGLPGSGNTGLEGSGIASIESPNFDVYPLSPDTDYQLYIRANCGGGVNSRWTIPLQFTTNCTPQNLPYTESFNLGGFPYCWDDEPYPGELAGISIVDDGSTPPALPYGGSGNMVLFNSYNDNIGPYSRLVSTPISTLGSDLKLDFQWFHSSGSTKDDRLQLQYSFDKENWIDLGPEIPRYNGTDEWTAYSRSFPEDVANQAFVFVGFKFFTDDGLDCYLDELVFSFQNDCYPPTNIYLESRDATSALISWEPSNSDVGTSYKWELRTAGAPGSGTGSGYVDSGNVPSSQTSKLLESLTSGENYYFYLAAECSPGEESDWSDAFVFTFCQNQTLPLYEGFNVSNFNIDPDCWQQEIIEGSPVITYQSIINNPSVTSDYEDGAGRMVYWNSNSFASDKLRLISPAFSTGGFSDLEISFQWYHSDLGGSDNYQGEGVQVQYSLDKENWQNVGEFIPRYNEVSGWFEKLRYLPPSALDHDQVFIGLKFSAEQGFNCVLDAFSVKVPECYAPSALQVYDISDATAVISWNEAFVPAAEGYIYEIRTNNAPGSGETDLFLKDSTIAGKTIDTLINLDPDQTYYAYVRSKCATGVYSAWTMQEKFKTIQCPTADLPVEQDFDASANMPDCWSTEFVVGNSPLAISTVKGSQFTPNSVWFNSAAFSLAHETRLISPSFNTSGISNLRIIFDWWHTKITPVRVESGMVLEYSLDRVNWIPIETYRGYDFSSSKWETYLEILPASVLDQEQVFLGFRFFSESDGDCFIDQIVIEEFIDCEPPTDVYSYLTHNQSSQFAWTPAALNPESFGYIYEVRSHGEPGSGDDGLIIEGVTEHEETATEIEGLPLDSTMYFYVSSNCGTSQSSWTEALEFTTCNAFNINYYQNFDANNDYPTCTRPQFLGNHNRDFTFDEPGYGGDGYNLSYTKQDFQDSSSTRYVLPAFTTIGQSDIEVLFQWYQNSSATTNSGVQLQYSLDMINWGNIGDFITYSGSITGYNLKRVPLAEEVENKPLLYIGLQFTSFGNTMLLDDFIVRTVNNCITPDNIVVNVLDNNSADISWNKPDADKDYRFEWEIRTSGEPGSGDDGLFDTNIEDLNVTAASISGLSENQNYVLYIRSYCDTELQQYSSWTLPYVFVTACTNQELPLVENFNTNDSIVFPACWSQQYVNETNNLRVFNASINPLLNHDADSTGRMITWKSNQYIDGSQTRLVSPLFNTNGIDGAMIEFMWYQTTDGGADFNLTEGVQVQFSFNKNDWFDAGDFTRRYNTFTGWSKEQIHLNDTLNDRNELYLGLLFTSNQGYNCYLDNLVIKERPQCAPPTDVSVTVQDPNSALVNWTSPGFDPDLGYIYEVRTFGEAASGETGLFKRDTTNPPTETSFTLSGLSPNQNYYVFVRSYCGADSLSVWSENEPFTTNCNSYSLPLTQNFDSLFLTIDPACWSQEVVRGNPAIYYTSSGTTPTLNQAYGGDGKMVYFDSRNANNGDSLRLISPKINTVGQSGLEVRFQWYHSLLNPEALTEGLQMQYSLDDGANWSDFGSLITRYNIANYWEKKSIALPAAVEDQSQVWLSFLFISNQSANCYLDEVEIIKTPTCARATQLNALALNDTQAQLSWNPPATIPTSGYLLEVRTRGDMGSGAQGLIFSGNIPSTESDTLLDVFVPYQNYYFSLKSICAPGDESDWSLPFVFHTTCDADQIPIVESFNTNADDEFPACWSEEQESGTGNLLFMTSSDDPLLQSDYDGGGRMVVWQSKDIAAGSKTRLISRSFSTVGVTGLGVEFRWYHSNLGSSDTDVEGVQLQYSYDGGASWTGFDPFIDRYNEQNNWRLYQSFIPEGAYGKDSVMIGFEFRSNNDANCYLDFVEIKTISSFCEPPETVFTLDETPTTATLVWSLPVYPPEDGYEYEVRINGLPGSGNLGRVRNGFTEAGTLSDAIIGLYPNTTYSCYVRSVCDADEGYSSAWSDEYSFTTGCAQYPLDYFEGFNVGRDEWLPECWSVDGNPDDLVMSKRRRNYNEPDGVLDTTYAYGYGGRMVDLYVTGGDYRVISPLITTEDIVEADVNFQLYMNGVGESYPGARLCGYPDNGVQLQYSSNLIDWFDFGELQNNVDAFIEGWVPRSVPMPPGALDEPNLYIGFKFKYPSSYDYRYFFDSLSIQLPPVCDRPENIQFTDIAYNSALISWDEPTNAGISYYCEIRTIGTVLLDTIGFVDSTTTVNNFIEVSDLDPDTHYTVYLRSNCADGSYGYWAYPLVFKTLPSLENIPFYEQFEDGNASVMPEGWSFREFCPRNAPEITTHGVGSEKAYGFSGKAVEFDREGSLLISPPISTEGQTGLQLEFQYFQLDADEKGDYDELMQLKLSYNKVDWYSFTDPISLYGDYDNWVEYVRVLPNELLEHEYFFIGFENINDSDDPSHTDADFWMDEVLVKPITTCPKPLNLSVITPNPSTVELSWEEPQNPPAQGYNIELRSYGNGNYGDEGLLYQNTVPPGTNSLTIEDFDGNGYLYFYQRSRCAVNDSSNWSFKRFYQVCNSPAQEIVEDFEQFSTDPMEQCWQFDGTASYSKIEIIDITSPTEREGKAIGYREYSYNCTSNTDDSLDAEFYLPAIQTLNRGRAELLFAWRHTDNTTVPTGFGAQVQYSFDHFNWIDTGPFIDLYHPDLEWVDQQILLPEETQNQPIVYVRFAFKNYWCGNRMVIDDVIFRAQETCSQPTGVAVEIISKDTVKLSWDRPSSFPLSGYQWELRNYGLPQSGYNGLVQAGELNPQDTTFIITGLEGNTVYQYYLRANCGAEQEFTDWTDTLEFVTECIPYTLDYLETFDTVGLSTDPKMPVCWTQENISGNAEFRIGTSTSQDPYLGVGKMLIWDAPGSANMSSRAISPSIKISGTGNVVRFYYSGDSDAQAEPRIQLQFKTDTDDTWYDLSRKFPLDTTEVFNQISVPLPDTLENKTINLGFLLEKYWYLDDIYIDQLTISNETPLSGIFYVPTDYATLELFIDDLNLKGVGPGGLTVVVEEDNAQVAPPGGYLITGSGAIDRPVNFIGNGNTITAALNNTAGALNDGIITLIGADYITIDDFVLQENPANNITDWATNNMTEFGIAQFTLYPEDGSKNLTITNCNIDLNKAYANTFGFYSTVRHTRDDVLTENIASEGGSHDTLVIQGCNITDVNQGIILDHEGRDANYIQIGGRNQVPNQKDYQPELGNAITNFGSFATMAQYGEETYSGSYGIRITDTRPTTDAHIESNTITSALGATTDGDIWGIYLNNGRGSNSTNQITIDYNQIELYSGNSSGDITGIYTNIGAWNTYDKEGIISLSNNTFNGMRHELIGRAEGDISFLRAAKLDVAYAKVHDNSFNTIRLNTIGETSLIYLYSAEAKDSITVMNNNLTGGLINTAERENSDDCAVLFINFGGARDYVRVANNTVEQVETDGKFVGIIKGYYAYWPTSEIHDNLISDISCHSGFNDPSYGINARRCDLHDNVVKNITCSGAFRGIYVYNNKSDYNSKVYNNQVYNLSHNDIFSGDQMNGLKIDCEAGIISAFNNFIFDIQSSAEGSMPVAGIYIEGSSSGEADVSYNTVFLNVDRSETSFDDFGSAALYSISDADLLLRNNVLVNTSDRYSSVTAALWFQNQSLTEYMTSSNGNDLHVGNGTGKHVFRYGSTNITSIENFKATMQTSNGGSDSRSFDEFPPFISDTEPYDLHIKEDVETALEKGGIRIENPLPINVDADGDTRGYYPDVGADEFDGLYIPLDDPIFIARGRNSHDIILEFTLNTQNEPIVIVFNETGIFTEIDTVPVVGENFAGGKVLTISDNDTEAFTHIGIIGTDTIIHPDSTIYYKAFSTVLDRYSYGVESSASPQIYEPET